MFEATFKIAALIESNEQGQRTFKIYQHEEPFTSSAFSSLVAALYQREVYQMLQAGDALTIMIHMNPPWRKIERTLRFREDLQFEGDAMQAPTTDLLPVITTMSEQFLQKMLPGDVFTVIFRVQRL